MKCVKAVLAIQFGEDQRITFTKAKKGLNPTNSQSYPQNLWIKEIKKNIIKAHKKQGFIEIFDRLPRFLFRNK